MDITSYDFNQKESTAIGNSSESKKQTALQKRFLAELQGQIPQQFLAKLSGESGVSVSDLTTALKEGNLGSKLSGKTLSAEAQIGKAYLEANRKELGLKDFFYQAGTITPIHEKDTLVGFKPGGPIARGGVGGGGSVQININGGNPAEVYRVVKRALEASRS